MRVIALGNLSGAVGDRAKGEEFDVDAKAGADLVARGLVVKAKPETAVPAKPEKQKE